MALGGSRAFSTAWGETRRGREFNRRGRRGGPVQPESLATVSSVFGHRHRDLASIDTPVNRHICGRRRKFRELPWGQRLHSDRCWPFPPDMSCFEDSSPPVELGVIAEFQRQLRWRRPRSSSVQPTQKLARRTSYFAQFTTLDRTGEPLISSSACRNWTSLSKECRTGPTGRCSNGEALAAAARALGVRIVENETGGEVIFAPVHH